MKPKKFSLNWLMQNNKFLLILSFVISIILWIYVSSGTTTDTNVTITDIPIQIELSDEARESGLEIFSGADQKASISVTGSRAILGSITSSDITVTASASSINSSGSYTLPVSATKANPSANFQLTSTVVPSSINVVVDYLRETNFQIQDKVVYKVADGYYASTSLESTTVVISGPQTEISKINKVCAVASIEGTLSDTIATDADIVLYDKDDNEISSDLLSMDFNTVKVTVNVMPEKEVGINLSFINKPEGLEITDDMVTIEPSSILLAGSKDVLENTTSVSLEDIDFSTLKNTTVTFDALGINIPTDCKNISNSTTAKVTLDLSDFSTKTFTVDSFTVKGLSSKYTSEITQQNISVTVVGPSDQIDDLKASAITGVIDVSDFNGTTGSVQMPVTFTYTDADSCWTYGTYKANVTISETS